MNEARIFRSCFALCCAGLRAGEFAATRYPTAVIAELMAQDWPGNARALMNAAMRFAMGLDDAVEDKGHGLAAQMAQVERSLLIAALQRHAGRAGETR